MNQEVYYVEQSEVESRSFINKVYGWMFLALVITGIVAAYTVSSRPLLNLVFGGRFNFYGLILAEFGMVIYLTRAIAKMSTTAAMIAFIAYSVLNGLTMSSIFLLYTQASIATTFFVAGGTFGIMSLYGYFSKADLTSIGNLMFMGLVGVIIATILNIFLKSEGLYWIITYVGIAVFIGLTAYDTQKIKKMSMMQMDGDVRSKAAIMGALSLYLDFINLFLLMLRLFGRRR